MVFLIDAYEIPILGSHSVNSVECIAIRSTVPNLSTRELFECFIYFAEPCHLHLRRGSDVFALRVDFATPHTEQTAGLLVASSAQDAQPGCRACRISYLLCSAGKSYNHGASKF